MHDIEAKSILSPQNGMNLYRGCTHGCIYCDSRSACYHMDHAFTDVAVKRNGPALLEEALRKKRSRCMIGTGSMCDPYLPLERTERLTRRCLEIVERMGFGFTVITKSDLVLRDLDLLKSVNGKARAVVQMTLTTYDRDLCRILEPNVCATERRVETLCLLREAGIETVVWLCPILPFINDDVGNLTGILKNCFDAGVTGILNFGMGLTLREGNREYFYQKLDEHFPGLKQRYIRAYGNRYECESPNGRELSRLFHRECEARGVLHDVNEIFNSLHAFPEAQEQLSLF